jgi:DNA-binding GntR family transcriptional regulator
MIVATARANGRGAGELRLKHEQAYEAIRTAIVRLELAPSSMIDETALCEQLGIGRTPVHYALQRLQHEGLVKIFPRRGMMVAPIDMLEAQHLIQARLMWEPNIVRFAAQVGQPRNWDDLEAILAETPETFATIEDATRGTAVNWRFHRGIAEATGNPFVVELLEQHHHRTTRLTFVYFHHGLYAPVTEQHYEILAALRAGDGDRAAELEAKHIGITLQRQAQILS